MKRVLLGVALACSAATSLAAADFNVTNINAAGPGSLHQAITDANSAVGADRILFNIPGAGIRTIDVSQNPLPAVVESLVIDGYSQPGAKPNALSIRDDAVILIQIDGGGSSAPPRNGLVFHGANSDYVVRGLCLTGFGVADSPASGVAINAGQVRSAVVTGNFIGLLPDGETPRGNGIGVGHVTQLGGTDPASRNVISGNNIGFAGEAAPFPGASVFGAVVQGNYIGTNASGSKAVPNGEGIGLETVSDGRSPCNGTESLDVDLSATLIGGTVTISSSASNLISGNGVGIKLGRVDVCGAPNLTMPVRANGVRIYRNSIGTAVASDNGLPNGSGITIVAGSNNLIGGSANGSFFGNTIAFNGSGIIVTGGAGSHGNLISRNSIYRNNGRGIDLGDDGVTPNDPNDADTGPNTLQNFPVIDLVTIITSPRGASSAGVKGTLHSTPNSTFRLEFFTTSEGRDPAVTGMGELFNHDTLVTTDASGNASFHVGFSTDPGRAAFTITATDSAGNTSEFSRPFVVPVPRLVNLSTRSFVGGGSNVLIGGFIIVGTENKRVMLRGLGPSLADAGVSGALADPTLELHDSTGALVASNHNWKDTQAEEINGTGIPPSRDAESAIVANLAARPATEGGATYTGILAGNDQTSGAGVLEIYDLAWDAKSKLVNISTRGYVGAGENVLIGGYIPRPLARVTLQLVIRALGPSLAAHGVNGTLQDPRLELHNANGTTIVSNDNWRESPDASRIAATGLPPSDDREAAVLQFVPAGTSGSYTAIVRGVNGATGVALVEVYALN